MEREVEVLSIDPQSLAEFETWLRAHGAHFPKLGFQGDISNMGGGVVATSSIDPNEPLASVPLKLCMTLAKAFEAYPFFQSLFSPSHPKGVSRTSILAVYLALESLNPSSFYRPYLDTLPRNSWNMSQMAGADLKWWFKGTNLGEGVVEERLEILRQDFKWISEILVKENLWDPRLEWDLFLWANFMVSSRAFPQNVLFPDEGLGPSEMMVPLLDMFNHNFGQKIIWQGRDGNVEFISNDTIKAGEQVYNNYGGKSNEELLLGYGFCIEDNPLDYVAVKLNFSGPAAASQRDSILKRHGLPLRHFLRRQGDLPSELLASLRILVANDMELASSDMNIEFIGPRNELAMLSTLSDLLKRKLLAIRNGGIDLPTPTSRWQHYAKWYRRGQELVLLHSVEQLQRLQRKAMKDLRDIVGVDEQQDPLLCILNGMNEDAVFRNTVLQLFGDSWSEQEEVCMMLLLIWERKKKASLWSEFLIEAGKGYERYDDPDLQEIYEDLASDLELLFSMPVAFADFQWAAKVLDDCGATISMPGEPGAPRFCIVPLSRSKPAAG
ncbi:uncharacterized protein VTP21DRAFT_5614 [Calcarisporiella thermophila]|uniref:uncharacterized protein n=1 Tax=Calcarisporiella thermophila TaxID=911321 RepID=UPI00374426A1